MKNTELEKLDFGGWPLPDEYLIEIGRISALWVTLEESLGVCIGKLAGFDGVFDPKPYILINHSSFPQKLDMFGALCEQLQDEYLELKQHKDVISKIRTAQKSRNKYLHNTIGPDEKNEIFQMAQASARGTLKASVTTITAADIRRAVIELDEANVALLNLVFKVNADPVWKRRQQ